MSLLDQLRKATPELADVSDDDILQAAHAYMGGDISHVADTLGYSAPKSNIGKDLYSGGNSYLANMGHIGSAMGIPGAAEYTAKKEARAKSLDALSGSPKSGDEMQFGDKDKGFLPYVGKLAAGSAPYIGEALGWTAADVVTGGALTPAVLARYGAGAARAIGGGRGLAAEQAAIQGQKFGRTAMIPAVTYPSSLGDVLSNQHEESGTYNLPAAAGYAIPYAGANVLGIEGAITKGAIPRLGLKGLEKNLVGRAASAGLATGASEAAGETFQETMNQAGRIAVNPNASMTSPEAMARYKESAIGGAILGGLPGAVGGMRKPLDKTKAKPTQLLGIPEGWQQGDEYADQAEVMNQMPGDTGVVDTALGILPPVPRPAPMPVAPAAPVQQTSNLDSGFDTLDTAFGDGMPPPAPPTTPPGGIGTNSQTRVNPKTPVQPTPEEQAAATTAKALLPHYVATLPPEQGKASEKALTAKMRAVMGGSPLNLEDAVGMLDARIEKILSPAKNSGENKTERLIRAEQLLMIRNAIQDTGQNIADIDARLTETRKVSRETEAKAKADAALAAAKGVPQVTATTPPAVVTPGVTPPVVEEKKGKTVVKTAKPLPLAQQPGPVTITKPDAPVVEAAPAAPVVTAPVATPVAEVPVVPGEKVVQRKKKVTATAPAVAGVAENTTGEVDVESARTAKVDEPAYQNPLGHVRDAILDSAVTGTKPENIARDRKIAEAWLDANPDETTSVDIASDLKAGVSDSRIRQIGAKAVKARAAYIAQEGMTAEKFNETIWKYSGEKSAGVAPDEKEDTGPSQEESTATDIEHDLMDTEQTITKTSGAQASDETTNRAITAADRAAVNDPKKLKKEIPDHKLHNMAAEYLDNGSPEKDRVHYEKIIAELNDRMKNKRHIDFDMNKVGTPVEKEEVAEAKPTPAAKKVAAKKAKKEAVTLTEKPAEPTVIHTESEKAAEAWNKAAAVYPGLGVWDKQLKGTQRTFTNFGEKNWKLADAIKLVEGLRKSEAQGQSDFQASTQDSADKTKPGEYYTSAELQREINGFIRTVNNEMVIVVDNVEQLPDELQKSLIAQWGENSKYIQAFVATDFDDNKAAFFIASQIRHGQARAVFMHEVGSHIGIETNLDMIEFRDLYNTIKSWEGQDSIEGNLATRARERVELAQKTGDRADELTSMKETIAYFIEEAIDAGATPTAMHAPKLKQWFDALRRFMMTALKKLNLAPRTLTTHDILNLAYGLAEKSMTAPAKPATSLPSAYSMQASTRTAAANAAFAVIPTPAHTYLKSMWANITTAAKNGMLMAAITEDIVDLAGKAMPSVGKFIAVQKERHAMRMAIEQDIKHIEEMYDGLTSKDERGIGPRSVNKFIHDATMKQQWGYAHGDDPVNAEMAQRFRAMSPKAQALIKAVFAHGDSMLATKKKVVIEAINADYAERIKDTDEVKEQQRLAHERDNQVHQYSELLKIQSKGPYAPLKRYGSYMVIAKSKAFVDAEEANDAPRLIKMRSDEAHYYMANADTQGEANAIAERIAPNYAGGEVTAAAKLADDAFKYSNHDMFLSFAKLRKTLDDTFRENEQAVKSGAYKQMNHMLRDMYLSTLAESSARKSEMRRAHVAGADLNMMRAFATQGRSDAHFLSTVKHGDAVLDAVNDMKKEAKVDRTTNMPYVNEMLKRHAASLEHRPHRGEDLIKRATSLWMLSTSPAFYLQQMSQTYMMSLPEIASRHGYFKSERYIRKAYKEIFGLQSAYNVKGDIDWTKAPADVRDMLVALTKSGKIDIGIDVDLGSWATQGSGRVSGAWNNADRWLRGVNVRVESINRAVAAIAAYRMEMERHSNKDGAIKYAESIIHKTHGSYDGFNTPRLLNNAFPGARVVTQFRRFQIIQISMLARMFHTSFKGATADERAVARKAIMFTLGHALLMGGAMGLPGMTALMYIAGKLFGGDDEPDKPEAWLREMIGDQQIADFLLNGAPAGFGMNLSGKLGYGNMLSLMPFQNVDLTSKAGYTQTAMAITGPFFGGLLPKMADGVGLVASGNYYKGMEQMLPNGMGNAMKGYRSYTDGVTMRNGDVVLSADEVSFLDATLQGLGLPTTVFTHRQMAQQNKYEYDTFFREKSESLVNDYAKAYRQNDAAELSEARDAWEKLQEARQRNGYTRQPLSTLLKAPFNQAKRERNSVGGVEYNKQNKGFVEKQTGQ